MMQKYRVAIIGCGKIAGVSDCPSKSGFIGTHAQAYLRDGRFEIVSAVDKDKKRLKKFCLLWNIPRGYLSVSKMLKHELPEVISICTPNNTHSAILRELLEDTSCPMVIFTEKPLCMHKVELSGLIKRQRKDCSIIVNHSRRFDPGHIRLKNYLSKRPLGELLSCRMDYYGGWLNNGCHLVDTLRMLFPGEKLKIKTASFCRFGRKNDPSLDVIASIGKAVVWINASDEKRFQIYENEFRFEKGRILLQDFGNLISVEDVIKNKLKESVLRPKVHWEGMNSPLYHAVRLIVRCLQDRDSCANRGVSFFDAAKVMQELWDARRIAGKN